VQKHAERVSAQLSAVHESASHWEACPLCAKPIALGTIPTRSEAARLSDTFAYRVLRTLPEWEATPPGERRKRSKFPRDNYRCGGVSYSGPHRCAITLHVQQWRLTQELKEETS
jgi:hypothetical protein